MSLRRYLVAIFETLDVRLLGIEGDTRIIAARTEELERGQATQTALLHEIRELLIHQNEQLRDNRAHAIDAIDRLGTRVKALEDRNKRIDREPG